MTVQLNNDGSLAITAMSLVEFLPEIEQAIHNGYMLDLEKNEGVPQQYGSMLVLTMYPVGEVEVTEIDKEDDFKHPDDSEIKIGFDPTVFTENFNPEIKVDPTERLTSPEPIKAAEAPSQETAVSTKDAQAVKVDKRKKS